MDGWMDEWIDKWILRCLAWVFKSHLAAAERSADFSAGYTETRKEDRKEGMKRRNIKKQEKESTIIDTGYTSLITSHPCTIPLLPQGPLPPGVGVSDTTVCNRMERRGEEGRADAIKEK